MKTSGTLVLSFVILLFLSSCYTIIYIAKPIEPEIILEKKANNLVFVNLFDYSIPKYISEKNEVSYHAGVTKFIEALSTFSDDKAYRFSVADTLKKGIGAGQQTSLLHAETVRIICNEHKADLLLALDSMNIFFDWETIVETDDKGNKSKTKNFFLYTRFYVSLYSAAGDLIKRSEVERSSFYKSRPTLSVIITIEPSIAKARDEVEKLSFQAGNDYVDKFYPQTIQVQRKIHSGKPFKESNSYIKNGDWDMAAGLLRELEKSPDSKIAKKAAQNLSVVKEAAESDVK